MAHGGIRFRPIRVFNITRRRLVKNGAFVFEAGIRRPVISLGPYLRESLSSRHFMDVSLMTEKDATRCKWVGYGIIKGVTNPTESLSVLALSKSLVRGLHADLISGFENVDSGMECYSPNHKKGFGNFVRWVFFADPKKEKDFFGIDFSLSERPTAGVACSLISASRVIKTVLLHGVPPDTECVLLDPTMCEPEYLTSVRSTLGFNTLHHWAEKAERLFKPDGAYCPRCGLETRRKKISFCSRCGCKPELFWK
ncbi:MAG: hypothetical protein UX72_C0024G0008 [Parcubacteria group bacterium GW2011_GWA2_47_10]|nr:MAG: hypothetical protein UX72_C0024G0008 [Parcubacteria group bacterium GW2011_GWA2_47_10]